MPSPEPFPTVAEIVSDLRVLRERGLVRLRHTDLAALRAAAGHTSVAAAAGHAPGAVEALLRAAVENLGGGTLGAAATHTFGLGRGARDRPAQDRRRQAAMVYGVSVERFRKHHERVVIEQVAEEIMKLCQAPHPAPDVVVPEFPRRVELTCMAGDARFPVTVHTGPVELLSGVDVVVVPENVYLELPQIFKHSLAASVRRASARRAPDGEVLWDGLAEELHAWVIKNGRAGLPVEPGTIAPTSPGEMAGQGIRRIYHAALTSPRPGTNDYLVEPAVVAQVARNALATARGEREEFAPPLASVAFPLPGAGRGGLRPQTSFAWLWAAIERDFRDHGPWQLHFITRRRLTADVIVDGLTAAGAVRQPD